MKKPLDVHMDALALRRLRALIRPWGGTIQIIDRSQEDALVDQRHYYACPFADGGVSFTKKICYLRGPIRKSKVAEVIHELAHIFASDRNPNRATEFNFLGWEMVVADTINLPRGPWRIGNANYQLHSLQDPKPPWARDVGDCTDAELELLYQDRLKEAQKLGSVSKDGEPLSVRTSEETP